MWLVVLGKEKKGGLLQTEVRQGVLHGNGYVETWCGEALNTEAGYCSRSKDNTLVIPREKRRVSDDQRNGRKKKKKRGWTVESELGKVNGAF